MVEKSPFANYFLDHEESSEHYLFNQWLSEDGKIYERNGLVKILSLGN